MTQHHFTELEIERKADLFWDRWFDRMVVAIVVLMGAIVYFMI